MESAIGITNVFEKIYSFLQLNDNPYFFNLENELQSIPNGIVDRILQKLEEIVENEPFKFKTLTLNLILLHEYSQAKNYADALKIVHTVEEEFNLEKDDHERMIFKKISSALQNFLLTYKIYILIKENNIEKAHEVLDLVVPFASLNDENKAAVYGIRSAVFLEYGLSGQKCALNYAKQANKLDLSNPYWFFLIGKSLGRIRRVEKPHDIPSSEERDVLEKAIKMDDNYLFMLFTAQVYAETANRAYRFHTRGGTMQPYVKASIDKLNDEASLLYRKSIEKESNCPHVLFRCAKGFMCLPHPQKNVRYAKDLLIKALKMAPRNLFGNHLLATLYERYEKNIDLAIQHLKICAENNVFGAHMDLLRIEFTYQEIDVLEKLQSLVMIYKETPRKLQILTQLASYHIFVNSDLIKACKLIKECVNMNYEDNIQNHRSLFVQLREPFNLLDVVIDEIKIKLETKHCPEKAEYEEFLHFLTESNILLPKGSAKNLKDEILKQQREFKSGQKIYSRKKFNSSKVTRKFTTVQKKNPPLEKSTYTASKSDNEERSNAIKETHEFFDSWIDGLKISENESKELSKDGENYLSKGYKNTKEKKFSSGDNWNERNNVPRENWKEGYENTKEKQFSSRNNRNEWNNVPTENWKEKHNVSRQNSKKKDSFSTQNWKEKNRNFTVTRPTNIVTKEEDNLSSKPSTSNHFVKSKLNEIKTDVNDGDDLMSFLRKK